MIRAVFFDIDGTLVSLKTKRCPDSTKAAIRALREKGIRVYVASGRSRFELEEQEMLRGMTFDGYLTNNGQIVYDGSWNLLRTVAMVPDEVRALVDYCDERSLPLWLVSEQRSRFNYHFNDRVPVVMAEIHTEIPERCDLQIVRSLAEQNGVTEQLKAENQMEWVRQMNACKAQAEEVVKAELIYN